MPAWIGLGSNLGDARAQVTRAMALVDGLAGVLIKARSSLYESEPWGLQDQPDFINAVIEVDADLEPTALLEQLQAIETSMGRVRDGKRWGPRLIDLDLLLVDDRVVHSGLLELPHPRMHQRRFVLEPLVEISPDVHIPGHGLAVDCLSRLERQSVKRVIKPT